MESLNIRMSQRKAKKKNFGDFVSTSNWSVKFGPPKNLDNEVSKEKVYSPKKSKENLNDLIPSEEKNKDISNNTISEKLDAQKNNTYGCQNKDVHLNEKTSSPKQIKNNVKPLKPLLKRKGDSCNNSLKRRLVRATGKTQIAKLLQERHLQKDKATKINPISAPTDENQYNEEDKHVCKKAGCGKKGLTCCVKVTNSCVEATGKTSRWYHISMEEHYCNACFEKFYRNKSNDCNQLHEWKRLWFQNSRADSNFKVITNYIAEKQLPFWVQCTRCGHWRCLANDVELSPTIVQNYTCIMGNLANATTKSQEIEDITRSPPNIKYSCSEPNDPSVDVAENPHSDWMALLKYVPYLKNSPAAPFLTGYYPDGVGMSAVDTNYNVQLQTFSSKSKENDILKPVENLEKLSLKSKHLKKCDATKSEAREHVSVMTSPGRRKRSLKSFQSPVEGLHSYFQPFYKPNERGKALCMRPDVMEMDEAEEFPGYYKDQTIYLAIRNLIIALWTYNPFHILTAPECCRHLILRGLTRVRLCTIDVPQILTFAIRKGLVNLGSIKRPIRPVKASTKPLNQSTGSDCGMLSSAYSKQKVIVIGAGPAGIAAARQLYNFGCDVICLEARDRIGGRVCDDWSLDGVCVGKGAQIINGCVNNPLALVSHQLGLKMHTLLPRCDLYACTNGTKGKRNSSTKAVSLTCDKRMDFHFNALLDIIVEWRQAQAEDALDCSLGEKIQEAHQEWMKQSGLSFNELEERLLDFHIGNLEFACGASLNEVSAFHWDQNEIFSQFSGDHTFVQYGFGTLLNAVSQGIDIRQKTPVTDIILDEKKVVVKTENEKEFTADRVLVTVPLAVLRSGSIRFSPPLSTPKLEALDRMGCGCIEKVAMLFPSRFWEKKIAGANYFGYVPSRPNTKGFFSIFYDVPYPQCEKSFVLMSIISGEAVEAMRKLTDAEVIKIALGILKDIFPEENVPRPKKYFVTRWRDDPYAQMAYSYVKCGSSGNDYDEIAKEIDGRIFFAGEGTNRHFPQTVTGAFLSGVREASKIVCYNKFESVPSA